TGSGSNSDRSRGRSRSGGRPGTGRQGGGREGAKGGAGKRPGPEGGGSKWGSSKPRPGQGDDNRRTDTASGRSKNKRIPPPPDVRPVTDAADGENARFERTEVVIERVHGDNVGSGRSSTSAKSKRRSQRRRARNRVHVDDIEMGGVGVSTANKLRSRLADAAVAFEAERFTEAERLLVSIQRLAPDVAEVHELLGLTRYRLGQWRRAIDQLERFHALTRSVEQHPVLADCHRALRNWSKVEQLWQELGEASPEPELIEEGRIVQAGAMADRGRVADAIRFLEKAPKVKGRPGVHHLRRWYALADLYERAGDNSRARRLFTDIATADADFGDAAERAASL
ncbi:MAG: tetratricopeptide repeat protein, partial [Acidimicrobiia bacterium]|nr:tetratricopeptide repeat protein [Acidimicrobiia bacterium]